LLHANFGFQRSNKIRYEQSPHQDKIAAPAEQQKCLQYHQQKQRFKQVARAGIVLVAIKNSVSPAGLSHGDCWYNNRKPLKQ
jgi:hypothetical protein